jgi:hypothetical protein
VVAGAFGRGGDAPSTSTEGTATPGGISVTFCGVSPSLEWVSTSGESSGGAARFLPFPAYVDVEGPAGGVMGAAVGASTF